MDNYEQHSQKKEPEYGIGTIVRHSIHGRGRIIDYGKEVYIVAFENREVKKFPFDSEVLNCVESHSDAQLDILKKAVKEVLGDHGILDCELELGKRWHRGELHLIPGDEATQKKVIPIETFFKKIIGVREKLRVLEQKINNNKNLSPEEKLELEGYISRCYGSMTTFNVLFAHKESHMSSS